MLGQMLPTTLRPSSTDLTAAVAWAATGGFAVLFMVQVKSAIVQRVLNRLQLYNVDVFKS